eukprot:GABU01009343.1.p3 GENE.GABU01009343.1~~GABU01009343.1.p3  ORF type:complete len:339 (-),score=71.95 GABU01009343.1:67-1026(-)
MENPKAYQNRQAEQDFGQHPAFVDQAIANPQVVRPRLPLQLPTGPNMPMGSNPGTPQRVGPNGMSPAQQQQMMNQMAMQMSNPGMGHPRGPGAKGPNQPPRGKGQRIVAPPGMQMPDGSPQGGMFFPPNMPDFYDPAFHQTMYQGPEYGHPGHHNPNFYPQDPVFHDPALYYMQGPPRGAPPMYSPQSPRGYDPEDPRFFQGYPQYGGHPQGPMYPPQYPPQKGQMGYPPGMHPGNADPRRQMMGPGPQMGMPGPRGPPGMGQMPPQQQHMYPQPHGQMPPPGMMRGPQNVPHQGPYPGQMYPMMHGAIAEEDLILQNA